MLCLSSSTLILNGGNCIFLQQLSKATHWREIASQFKQRTVSLDGDDDVDDDDEEENDTG
jgi:hypothetical protein